MSEPITFDASPCPFCSGDYAASFDGDAWDRKEEPWTIEHTRPMCPAAANLTGSKFLRAVHVEKGYYREKGR